ncbi:MerR family transcriptional regulator [Evansella sp. LMS18]|uniref:MerR family transcriptional regulator n=1 Tax=Evansella sp. LMS18 TaxID=2924033 RepID=UPI0020D0866D|nr:MerR family transcriptional regulator [Evansella sp. LMS18]UTR12335.1 MerR family transcriptional regulator [Evansella sp. LMS18]
MNYKVKEVADLVGISIRTLHHYDELGLLSPAKITEAGYRLYSEEDLEQLQQILFFKELGFSLKNIKEIINSPNFDREEALLQQRKFLQEKKRRLENMIETLDKTIKYTRGEINMSDREKFEGFDFSKNPYEQEAREKWGDQAVDQANKKLEKLTAEGKKELGNEADEIYRNLAALKDKVSPASPEAQAAIKKWFDYLNSNFGDYSLQAFKGLGQMYVADERFTRNIDQYGDGLAKFMCKAMEFFTDSNTRT